MKSRSGRVASRAVSLMTAQGTAKAPSQFFLPKKLTAFLTPTPESAWASVVVGSRTRRMPRWAMAAAKPTASSTAPPPTTTT